MTDRSKIDSNAVLDVVRTAVERHGTKREELIPIMNDVNRELGYLPDAALEEISKMLETPTSKLFSVATFYHMLSTKPRGRHVIQFCESAPCHVVGGREVWEALKENLGLEPDETSKERQMELITTSCLGVCGVGPVIMIDDDIYGSVKPGDVPDILSRYS